MPSTIVIQRPGQVNLAGPVDATNLLQFAGEILGEFNNATVFQDRHTVRTISGGKSA